MEFNLPIEAKDIMKLLPHRYPILLVDRVIGFDKELGDKKRVGRKIKAIKNVSVNELFFNGHFPENPIMPGVLIVETMAQVGGISCQYGLKSKNGSFLIAKIEGAKFKKPIIPGDQLVITSEIIKDRGAIILIACRAEVDGQLAAEAKIWAHVSEAPPESAS